MAEETEYIISTTVPATATATAQIPAAFTGCHAHGSDMLSQSLLRRPCSSFPGAQDADTNMGQILPHAIR